MYDFTTFIRNCEVEQTVPLEASITGEIPPWLRGSFLLNGPGILKYGNHEYNHFFDGGAVLQKFEFNETGVVYTNRYLKTAAFKANSEQKEIVVSEFGTKGQATENKGLLQKLGDKFAFDKLFSDNAPVNIVNFGGELYANTEAPFLHKIDPITLETTGKVDLHKELGINSQCPHPITLEDGTTVNILHEVGGTGPRYGIVQFDAKCPQGQKSVFSKPKKLGALDTRWKLNPCHLHSFGMTSNYVIIPEQPLTIDVKQMVANSVRNKPFIDGMEWLEGKMVKIRVFDKKTGKENKIKYKTEAFNFVHIVNSFELNRNLIMDICSYDKPTLLHNLYIKQLRSAGPDFAKNFDMGCVKRLVIPLEVNEKSGSGTNMITMSNCKAQAIHDKKGFVRLVPEIICNNSYEIPAFNLSHSMKPYRYYYGASSDMTVQCGGVGKVDFNTRQVTEWHENNLYASVPVFVPQPNAQAEDDGIVLVHCLKGSSDQKDSVVVILDAKSMKEIAQITAHTHSDAPRTLHGIFIP